MTKSTYHITLMELNRKGTERWIGNLKQDPFWTGLSIVNVPNKHGKFVTLSKTVKSYNPTYVLCALQDISYHLSAEDLNKFHDKNPDEEIYIWPD